MADNEFEPIEKCVFVRAIYLIREIRSVVTSSFIRLCLFETRCFNRVVLLIYLPRKRKRKC